VTETEAPLLGRAAKIATVLGRYGARGSSATPQQLRAALEELGPTFAKLGQILSTRPDLLPPEVIAELQTLQDRVTPMTEAEVVSVMEEELGVPWEDVFESIEPEPLAAGTIAQVHRARLESGEDVVVKVQRPTAEEAILRDLALLELFAEKAGRRPALGRIVDFPLVVEHLSSSLRRELDFGQEAAHVARMRELVRDFPRLDVPLVHERLSTRRLLVLEFIAGIPVREAPEGGERRDAARQLLEAFYRHVLVDGFFHADPHPGNMRWASDRIYFFDLGMVGELPPDQRELMLLLLLAFWQGDTRFLPEVLLLLGGRPAADVDLGALERDLEVLLAKYRTATLAEIELGPILQGMTEIAATHGIRLPASLALTAKALSQMQLTAAVLDPTLDPFSVIGKFLLGDIVGRIRRTGDVKRLYYDLQKLQLRGTRLVEALEQVLGARPGANLQVDIRGTSPLEQTIRSASRRVGLAVTGGASIVAAGSTAGSDVAAWIPATFGAAGGTLVALLLADLLRRA
jgi:ubiquinone biosynthesis protein